MKTSMSPESDKSCLRVEVGGDVFDGSRPEILKVEDAEFV